MKIEVLMPPESEKDLKKMRIRSIWDDMEVFKKAIIQAPDSLNGTFCIPKLMGINVPVFKFKKFRCRELGKGTKNLIRLIYVYFEEDGKILLIEMYKKSQQTNHNIERIKKCIEGYYIWKEQQRKDARSFM